MSHDNKQQWHAVPHSEVSGKSAGVDVGTYHAMEVIGIRLGGMSFPIIDDAVKADLGARR